MIYLNNRALRDDFKRIQKMFWYCKVAVVFITGRSRHLTKLYIMKLFYNYHYYSEHIHLRRRKQKHYRFVRSFGTEHTICFLPFTIFNSPVSVEINQFSKSN